MTRSRPAAHRSSTDRFNEDDSALTATTRHRGKPSTRPTSRCRACCGRLRARHDGAREDRIDRYGCGAGDARRPRRAHRRDVGEHYFGAPVRLAVLSIDRVRFIVNSLPRCRRYAANCRRVAAINVEYEELPACSIRKSTPSRCACLARASGKISVHVSKRPVHAHPNIQGYQNTTIGDVAAGFAQADRVFEHVFTTPRYHGGYLEPRATMVWIDAAAPCTWSQPTSRRSACASNWP